MFPPILDTFACRNILTHQAKYNLVCIILMICKLRILHWMNNSAIKYQNFKKDGASIIQAHKYMTVQLPGLAQTLQ